MKVSVDLLESVSTHYGKEPRARQNGICGKDGSDTKPMAITIPRKASISSKQTSTHIVLDIFFCSHTLAY